MNIVLLKYSFTYFNLIKFLTIFPIIYSIKIYEIYIQIFRYGPQGLEHSKNHYFKFNVNVFLFSCGYSVYFIPHSSNIIFEAFTPSVSLYLSDK